MPGKLPAEKRGSVSAAKHKSYYPAFLDLSGKKCVVVGGGTVAERKVRSLCAAGAFVTVVSPQLSRDLELLHANGTIQYIAQKYRRGDLRGAFLVIAATSDIAVNERVAKDAAGLINVADQPESGNIIVPSSVKRGQLVIAVSTLGASPALSRTIRKELETLYPAAVAAYLAFIGSLRKKAMSSIQSPWKRAQFFREIASGAMLDRVRQLGYRAVAAEVRTLFRRYERGEL
ncbi:MAG TPA: bifunctional precorrin-2 dehydrogenase/sirohydrochlorin ferrochelatase [Dissulfurispiraceae bacterium]|nr:bifunctional precorrin-2 dehydrogenase/sirohydrochlorin ferrochelatase [Dissulfurispiraceae bacterium]